MKSYTDIKQSKKLAEILPIESADMEYLAIKENGALVGTVPFVKDDSEVEDSAYSHIYDRIACWSLAALLDVLESEIDGEEGETYQLNIEKDGTWWYVWYDERYDAANPIEAKSTEDLIDAYCEMIIKLHEENLL